MNLNKALNEAIEKGAKRANRKNMAKMRSEVIELKHMVAELARNMKMLQREAPLCQQAEEPATTAVVSIRPTAAMVRKLRQKLDVTQAQLAKLIGVSGLTIYKWEKTKGRINMRSRAREGLLRVRSMSKREAKKALVTE